MTHRTELILFLAYFVAGPFAWLAYGVLMHAGRRKMLLLRRPVPPLKTPPPSVTLLIPAKDEGERIRSCRPGHRCEARPCVVARADQANDQSRDEHGATPAPHPHHARSLALAEIARVGPS